MDSDPNKNQVSLLNESLVLGSGSPVIDEMKHEHTNAPNTPELVPIPGLDVVKPLMWDRLGFGNGMSSSLTCRAIILAIF
jgi:hypothetical protein